MIGTAFLGGGRGANALCRLDSVENRHLHVHQHDIVIGAAHGLDRQLAILDDIDLVVGLAKQHRDQLLVDLVVFGEKDSQQTGRPVAAGGSGARRRFRAPHARQSRTAVQRRRAATARGPAWSAPHRSIPEVPSARPCRPADEAMTILVSARPCRRADSLGQCFTRKARHHLVDDDEVERVAPVKGALQFGHRGEAVIDRNRLDAEAGQLTRQNAPVHLDIVDDQDTRDPPACRAARGVRPSG